MKDKPLSVKKMNDPCMYVRLGFVRLIVVSQSVRAIFRDVIKFNDDYVIKFKMLLLLAWI